MQNHTLFTSRNLTKAGEALVFCNIFKTQIYSLQLGTCQSNMCKLKRKFTTEGNQNVWIICPFFLRKKSKTFGFINGLKQLEY